MLRFDRWAVCDAYYWYAMQYHGGQESKLYRVFGRLDRIGYKSGLGVQHGRLTHEAAEVFERLVRKGNHGNE